MNEIKMTPSLADALRKWAHEVKSRPSLTTREGLLLEEIPKELRGPLDFGPYLANGHSVYGDKTNHIAHSGAGMDDIHGGPEKAAKWLCDLMNDGRKWRKQEGTL